MMKMPLFGEVEGKKKKKVKIVKISEVLEI